MATQPLDAKSPDATKTLDAKVSAPAQKRWRDELVGEFKSLRARTALAAAITIGSVGGWLYAAHHPLQPSVQPAVAHTQQYSQEQSQTAQGSSAEQASAIGLERSTSAQNARPQYTISAAPLRAELGPVRIAATIGGKTTTRAIYSAQSAAFELKPGEGITPLLPEAQPGQHVKITLPKGHDPRLENIIAHKRTITYEDASSLGGIKTKIGVKLMQGDTQLRSYNITLEARAAAPAVPHIGTQQAVSSRAAQEVTVFPSQNAVPSQRTADKYKAVPQRTQHEIFITPGMGKYKEEKHDSYTIISKYSPAFQQPSQYNQGIRVSQYSTLGSFSRVQHSISPQRSIIQQRSILEQRSILQYSIVPQYSMRHSLTPGNLAFRQYTPVFQHNGLGYGTEQYSLRRAGITAMCCPVRSKATLSVVQNPQGFLSFAATHA